MSRNDDPRETHARTPDGRPVAHETRRPKFLVTRLYQIECLACDLIVDAQRTRTGAEEAKRHHAALHKDGTHHAH